MAPALTPTTTGPVREPDRSKRVPHWTVAIPRPHRCSSPAGPLILRTGSLVALWLAAAGCASSPDSLMPTPATQATQPQPLFPVEGAASPFIPATEST